MPFSLSPCCCCAQEMAEELNVRIFTAEIIYHLFDQFTAFMNGLNEVNALLLCSCTQGMYLYVCEYVCMCDVCEVCVICWLVASSNIFLALRST